MNHDQKKANDRKRQFAFRLNVFFFGIFMLFSILIVRLAFIQFVEGRELSQLKTENSTATVPIAPIRGNIVDREGRYIAYSTSTQSLFYRIEPGQNREEIRALADQLSDIFARFGDEGGPQLSADDILNRMDLNASMDALYAPRRIKSGLSRAEIAYIMEHENRLPGVEIVEESVRNYNESNPIAVQLVGYLRQYNTAISGSGYLDYYDNVGDTEYLLTETVGYDGLEFLYQKELRGRNGSKSFTIDPLGKIVRSLGVVPPIKGQNIYLTLDNQVQLTAEQAILDHLQFMKEDELYRKFGGPDAVHGYAVAMEVETGKVVAMASMPDYHPKIWKGGHISPKDYAENQKYLRNGAIAERYAPLEDPNEVRKHPSSLVPLGSTIKPLSILIGLKEGLFTPNTIYNDTGTFYYGRDNNASVSNSGTHAPRKITAYEALVKSSNTFMSAMVGNELYKKYAELPLDGIEIWDRYMEQFGLGVKTGSGLPGEISGIKGYMDVRAMGSTQSSLVFSSWGQGGRYTALQLAQYAATLASKGKRMKPQFVDKITTYDGTLVREIEPEVLNTVEFDDAHWDLVHRAMLEVNRRGFEGVEYSVAAKTGTSTSDIAGRHVDNAVFIAFAPAEKPKLAVAVVVPEGGFGAWGAAPIARHIFDAYHEQVGLFD